MILRLMRALSESSIVVANALADVTIDSSDNNVVWIIDASGRFGRSGWKGRAVVDDGGDWPGCISTDEVSVSLEIPPLPNSNPCGSECANTTSIVHAMTNFKPFVILNSRLGIHRKTHYIDWFHELEVTQQCQRELHLYAPRSAKVNE